MKLILWGQSKCGEISLITSFDRAMYQYCVLLVSHLAKLSLVICRNISQRVFLKRQTYVNDEIRGELKAIFKVTNGLL